MRALQAIGAGVAPARLPTGGFAAASSDGIIRLYTRDGVAAGELAGHKSLVTSLALTPSGQLVSGSWDGTARVWDLESGETVQEIPGLENHVCVAALANGDIVVGTTGEVVDGKHVHYRVRQYRGGDVHAMLEDHEAAVQTVVALPGGEFASAGNDGTIRVRSADGATVNTFANPQSGPDPEAVFKLCALPDGQMTSCSEDCTVRFYSGGALVETVHFPGQPWDVAQLDNGDIVIVGNQQGRSTLGRAFIFTHDATRAADDALLAAFEEYMKPPERSSGSGGAGGGSMSGGGLPSRGPHSEKAAYPGSRAGEYGAFTTSDGRTMICMWDGAAWEDIGYQTEDPTGSPPDASEWDVVAPLSLDKDEGGKMTETYLKFNISESPMDITRRYMQEYNLSEGFYEQIKDFVIQQWTRAGGSFGDVTNPLERKEEHTRFGRLGFAKFGQIKFDKVLAKLREFNAVVAASDAGLALTDAELSLLDKVAATLGATSFYHSSSFSAAEIEVLQGKLLRWPAEQAFPALHLYGVFLTHPRGAEATLAKAHEVVSAIMGYVGGDSSPPPTVLLGLRALCNLFTTGPTRTVMASPAVAGDVLDLIGRFVDSDNKNIRYAVAMIASHYADSYFECKRGTRTGVDGGPPAVEAAYAGTAVSLVLQLCVRLLHSSTEPNTVNTALYAIGTALLTGEGAKKAAAEAGLAAALGGPGVAACGGDANVAASVADVRKLM